MKSEFLSDGNYIGRLGAVALIGLAFYGVHKLNCDSGMCPVMKTDSCCTTPAEAHAPAPAAKPATK